LTSSRQADLELAAPGLAARTDRRLQTPRRVRESANVPFYAATETTSPVASRSVAALWSRDRSARTVPQQWGTFHNYGEARVDGRLSGADPYGWPSVRHIPKDPEGAKGPRSASASPHRVSGSRSRDLGDFLALVQGGARAPKPIPLSGSKARASCLDEWHAHKQEFLRGPHQRTVSTHQPWRTKDVGFSFGSTTRDARPWPGASGEGVVVTAPSGAKSRGQSSSPRPLSAEPGPNSRRPPRRSARSVEGTIRA